MLTDDLSTVGSIDLLSRLASTFRLLFNLLLRYSYLSGSITSVSGLLSLDRIEIVRSFLL